MCTEEVGKVAVCAFYRVNTWLTGCWLCLLKPLSSRGHIERLSETRGQLGCFFSEGPQCCKRAWPAYKRKQKVLVLFGWAFAIDAVLSLIPPLSLPFSLSPSLSASPYHLCHCASHLHSLSFDLYFCGLKDHIWRNLNIHQFFDSKFSRNQCATNPCGHAKRHSQQCVTFLPTLFWFFVCFFCVCVSDLLPATEYGIGISAMKGSNQSSPATMNARTGEQMTVYKAPQHQCWD